MPKQTTPTEVPLAQSAPSENDPSKQNLVNEKEPETLESVSRQLKDAREETARSKKHTENLLATIKDQSARIERLEKKAERVQPDNESEFKEDELYEGPSLEDIYLAIVTGCFANGIPKNDQFVTDLANSTLGMAEIFFHRATRRNSFRRREESAHVDDASR